MRSHEHLNNSKLFQQASAKDTSTHTNTHTHTHTQGYKYRYSRTHRQPHLQKRTHCGKMETTNFKKSLKRKMNQKGKKKKEKSLKKT